MRRLLPTALRGFRSLGRDRRGATVVEYALIIALIVLAMMVSLRTFANASTSMWNNVSSKVVALI
jgi:pilus assembly protein Flp/PilA